MTFPRTRICALSCICAQPASMRTYLYYRCVRIHISPPVFRHLLYLLILSLMSIADGCHPPFSFSLCSLQVDVIRRLPFLYVHYRWMSSTALLFLHSQICIYQKKVVPLHRKRDNLGPPTGANVVHPVGRAETPNAQMTTLSSVNARGCR